MTGFGFLECFPACFSLLLQTTAWWLPSSKTDTVGNKLRKKPVDIRSRLQDQNRGKRWLNIALNCRDDCRDVLWLQESEKQLFANMLLLIEIYFFLFLKIKLKHLPLRLTKKEAWKTIIDAQVALSCRGYIFTALFLFISWSNTRCCSCRSSFQTVKLHFLLTEESFSAFSLKLRHSLFPHNTPTSSSNGWSCPSDTAIPWSPT